MSRHPSHKIETKAIDIVRVNANQHDALYRELNGRDYGIDAVIELFNHDAITGRIALIQIKGSESRYRVGTRNRSVSCQVSQGTFDYLNQSNIPVVLVAVDTTNECFYYACLAIAEVVDREADQPTVHLEADCVCRKDEPVFIEWLKQLANEYYGGQEQ